MLNNNVGKVLWLYSIPKCKTCRVLWMGNKQEKISDANQLKKNNPW